MDRSEFQHTLRRLFDEHSDLVERPNKKAAGGNGVFDRYVHPVLTAAHTPVFWRYDLDCESNPHLMERLGINSVFNPGAIYLEGKFCLVARVEGVDRKSFFAVADSFTGVDRFCFRRHPITMPQTDDPDVNVYDIRLTQHEDGWIYGVFCTERKDPNAAPSDTGAAVARCGIARTKDLDTWERLHDLKTPSPQQRNAVLHPEFVNGMYAFYTRPQDGFIDAGTGGGIGWGLCDSIEHAVIDTESIIDDRQYHTHKETKNGLGPPPIKTNKGWLQLAHGVRNTAAGLAYVLYAFLAKLDEPNVVIHQPGGYLLAPRGDERIGDVSNVAFSNGWIATEAGDVYLYYASSDTRIHVATTTVDKLLDYVLNTPPDPLRTFACRRLRDDLIDRNLRIIESMIPGPRIGPPRDHK